MMHNVKVFVTNRAYCCMRNNFTLVIYRVIKNLSCKTDQIRNVNFSAFIEINQYLGCQFGIHIFG